MAKEILQKSVCSLTVLSLLGWGFLSCGPQKNAALSQARTSYMSASADSEIAKHGAVHLHEAENYLELAEKTDDQEQKKHLAYLINQKVKVAQMTSEKKAAEQDLSTLHEQRDAIVLGAREREAELANQRATKAEREAKRALIEKKRAEMKNAQLEKKLDELSSKLTDRGLEFTLQGMLFEFNKAELNPGGERILQKLVQVVKENSDRKILIEGHTDSLGSEPYNLDLSKKRAKTVEQFLEKQGIPSERVTVRGYGEVYPVAPNTTEAGRQQNRRVEVVLLDLDKTIEQVERKSDTQN